jgi:hypothetical protein
MGWFWGCKHVWSKWIFIGPMHIVQERECLKCGKAQTRLT